MKKSKLRPKTLHTYLYRQCLSQAGFAAKAGISPTYLSLLLAGRKIPGPRVRRRLLDAMKESGVEFDELFELVP